VDTLYGRKSRRGGVNLEYTNAETQADIGMRYRQRVNRPIAYLGRSVHERERRTEPFVTLPRPVRDKLSTRQNFRLTLSSSEFKPAFISAPVAPWTL
jgi:hypothetical protein